MDKFYKMYVNLHALSNQKELALHFFSSYCSQVIFPFLIICVSVSLSFSLPAAPKYVALRKMHCQMQNANLVRFSLSRSAFAYREFLVQLNNFVHVNYT